MKHLIQALCAPAWFFHSWKFCPIVDKNNPQLSIAQIENRVGIGKITFDVLLNILTALGHEYEITIQKVREPVLEDTPASL